MKVEILLNQVNSIDDMITNECFLDIKFISHHIDDIERYVEYILTNGEMKYYNSLYRNKLRQRQTLWSRLLCKKILIGHGIAKQFSELELLVGEKYGKPLLYLKGTRCQQDISVAHCNNLIGVAISSKTSIGLDIERINPSDGNDITEFAFSEREKETWIPYKKKDTFYFYYWIWTIKEAIAKATGIGFYYGAKVLEILFYNENTILRTENQFFINALANKYIRLYSTIIDDYYVTLCELVDKE